MDANRKKADCYDILLRFGDTESAIQREHNILGNPEIERGVRYISDYTLPPVLLLGHEGLRKLPVSLELTYKNKCVARKFGPDGDALVMLEVYCQERTLGKCGEHDGKGKSGHSVGSKESPSISNAKEALCELQIWKAEDWCFIEAVKFDSNGKVLAAYREEGATTKLLETAMQKIVGRIASEDKNIVPVDRNNAAENAAPGEARKEKTPQNPEPKDGKKEIQAPVPVHRPSTAGNADFEGQGK